MLVTIFGGSGFLGTQVAQALMSRGLRVRVAARSLSKARHIKPLGNLGQSQVISADVRKPASVARAIHGADAVINLVGAFADMDAVQHQGAGIVAQAAAAAGVSALVHVSAIGADSQSDSAYGRSKGDGEAAVRAAFPQATILRPSIIFGAGDQFINRFAGLIASLPVVPVIGGKARFQPVHVADVAGAIAAAVTDPAQFGGQTFEIAGPDVISMADINSRIAAAQGRNVTFLPVPDVAAGLLAATTGWLPGAPITSDQWKMLQKDNVASGELPGLAAFGIAPKPLSLFLDDWMVAYRKHGRFTKASA